MLNQTLFCEGVTLMVKNFAFSKTVCDRPNVFGVPCCEGHLPFRALSGKNLATLKNPSNTA